MLEDDNTASETYELYGPENLSMEELAAIVDKEIFKKRRHIHMSKRILQPVSTFLNEWVWFTVTSGDQIEREFIDQAIDPSAKTFKDLGIEPANVRNLTYHYLVSDRASALQLPLMLTAILRSQQGYRDSSDFNLPPTTDKERREMKGQVHIIDQ